MLAESSSVAELAGGFLEVVFVSDGADGQSTGDCDFLLGEAFAAGYFDRDELVGDGGRGGGRSFLSGGEWAELGDEQGGKKDPREKYLKECIHLLRSGRRNIAGFVFLGNLDEGEGSAA